MSIMTIRKATMSDLPALVALAKACVAAMIASGNKQWDDSYPNAQVMSQDIAAQTLDVLCEEGGTDADGKRSEGEIIGCITIDRFMHPLWQTLDWHLPPETAVAVHRLMVHPAHQGKGLARRLMQHTEDVAAEQGCISIRLDTFHQNAAALALYPRLGYRFTGIVILRPEKGEYSGFEKALRITALALTRQPYTPHPASKPIFRARMVWESSPWGKR